MIGQRQSGLDAQLQNSSGPRIVLKAVARERSPVDRRANEARGSLVLRSILKSLLTLAVNRFHTMNRSARAVGKIVWAIVNPPSLHARYCYESPGYSHIAYFRIFVRGALNRDLNKEAGESCCIFGCT
jgi:hypothetical protein